jgi:hypothetical protein
MSQARFVGSTSCTAEETSQGGNPVTTSWSVTGPDGTRSGSGLVVRIAIDQVAHPGGAYTIVFTNTYRAGSPTPTPSPSATEVPDVPQKPVDPPTLPEVITPDVPTVVLPGEVESNSGQKVTARITCTPIARMLALGKAPMGDVTVCAVKRSAGGKLTVTVSSPMPVRVTLTLTAPGTDTFKPYHYTRTWVTR